MTAQPRAPVRFRRAMERRALWMAEDPAREFPNLPLEDALAASCICTSSEVHRRLSRRRGGGSCGRHRELRRANRERILDVFVCESPVPGTETVRRASPLVFADTFAPRGPTLAPTLRLLMFNRTPGPILMLRRKRHAMPRMIAAAHEVVDLSVGSAAMRGFIPVVLLLLALAVTASASASVRKVSFTVVVSPNDYASLTVNVSPPARCSIKVVYDTVVSSARGLVKKTGGRITWRWKVGSNTNPGRWPVTVDCGKRGKLSLRLRVLHG